MTKRMVYDGVFEDDTLGQMPIPARLLWVGIITAVADDQGRMLDHASLVRSRVFPYDTEITNEMVAKWLDGMVDTEMLLRYQVDDKKLLQVRHWWDYQAPSWAQESKYPAPATWTDRIKVQKGGGNVYILNWSEQGGLPIGIGKSIGKAIGKAIGMDIGKGIPKGIEKNKNKIKNKDKDKIVVDRWDCTDFPDAYSKFEENVAKITEKNESAIRNWINIVGEETFIEAIKVAVLSNKKSLSYISGVLKNWTKEEKI